MSDRGSLPIIDRDDSTSAANEDRRVRSLMVHGFRVAVLLAIVVLIRLANHDTQYVQSELATNEIALAFAREAFESFHSLDSNISPAGEVHVLDRGGQRVGYLLLTSRASDHLIGYSGPTNCLIAVDADHRIASLRILGSGDTVEHVEAVEKERAFFDAFVGCRVGLDSDSSSDTNADRQWDLIDAVSGATLTSHAVIASVANRVGQSAPSLKFDPRPSLDKVSLLIRNAKVLRVTGRAAVWDVLDEQSLPIGQVLIATPAADQVMGYQGPSAALAAFDANGQCLGVALDQTYDNQPYANYLNEDAFFQQLYVGKTLGQIASMTPESEQIDGVSGATMTSVCVADGLALAAAETLRSTSELTNVVAGNYVRGWDSYLLDAATIALVLIGLAFSVTSLAAKKWLRVAYQWIVIGILGFVSGHMLSQVSLAGWSAHAVPWSVAPGLVFLCFAALLVPIVSKHQPYCQHICPFGAIQQLARHRVRWRLSIPRAIHRMRGAIPFVLLAVTVVVAVSGSRFNLASVEPFDAFSFRVAGWATISVFVVGILLSLVSPMAYCRFGCPTGALLNFVRFRSDSHRLGLRDAAAVALLLLAIWCDMA